MKIALAQINTIVGDLEGNKNKILDCAKRAQKKNAHLLVTSELSLLGYFPRDLLLQQSFIKKSHEILEELALNLEKIMPTLVGIALPNNSKGKALFNGMALLDQGKIQTFFHKRLLPTYDVFDEARYFEPALQTGTFQWKDFTIGVTICEDMWNDPLFSSGQNYHTNPIEDLSREKIDLIINCSASPFSVDKQKIREKILSHLARKIHKPFFYVNQVGGNDDLVFDGRSCTFDQTGMLMANAKSFQEDLLIVEINKKGRQTLAIATKEEEIWKALVLGTRDYVRKCGFSQVLLGLSGGIDSALTAMIAVEALGKENVLGVLMPSPYSSQGSLDDSIKQANFLGIKTITLPILELMDSFEMVLKQPFQAYSKDVTEENLQARIRGTLLMALSNKYGSLLLTTGNKSELAVGYCTLYGDMSGALGVIADVPKTMVYKICHWLNRKAEIIPREILSKPPSAELRPDQKDQDSLPSYEILDQILQLHIEDHLDLDEIVQKGFEKITVERILKLVHQAEFKRKQTPPGIKVTDRAFGSGWRMPLACRRL